MRFLAAAAATALSGWLHALTFPPASLQPLAWVALVPFLLTLRSVSTRSALLLTWLFGVLFSAFVADALPRAIETYFLQPRLASVLFAVFVWTVTGSLYWMGFAWVYRRLALRGGIALPLLAAAAWTAFELARGRLLNGSRLFAGNPWGLAGYALADWDELIQVASLTGVYGISFCIVALNAALAELCLALRSERRISRRVLAQLGVAVAPTLLALGFGMLVLRAAPAPGSEVGVPIAIVQSNFAVGSQWRPDAYGTNLADQLRLTAEAIESSEPRIVFWPESALTFFLEDEPEYSDAIARVLGPADLELLVGGPRKTGVARPRFFNTVFALDSGGAVRGRYDKQVLVPFAEYLPLRRFDFLRRRFERVRVFEHGSEVSPLPTRAGPAGVLVCNEAMYPELARARVRAGATYLANPSNDTWIQDQIWADRMFDIVSLRAVEQRRYLVRASTSGPSAIVDPWGRVIERSAAFSRAVISGAIVPSEELSLYGIVGDAFAYGCALAVALALARRGSLLR
jgi:apolipoprotein N-acyltransferase